ncbi:MAG TPA: hypothetical protein DEB06_10805 [Phycisphaerales bacterium]|nr:hypothetical protein [Phycisphaerales bacterium]
MEPDDAQPMPAHLRRSVEARARREQNAPAPAIVGQIRPARSGGVSPWWVAAAAVIGVLVGGWPRGASTGAPSIAAVAGARDVVRASWQTAGELQSVQVSGEAVWSSERQAGYMRFAGLPVNDPAVEQYQLWIFDPSQPEATPIDGGVFNIASTGDVVVPIDPKLKVSGPTLFALTIEKPGGVVVSDRKRLVLVCKPT